jgi:ribosomal protein L37AE/L43A
MRRLLQRQREADIGRPPYCSFCDKGHGRKRKVTRRNDGLYICDECVERVMDALSRADVEKHLK